MSGFEFQNFPLYEVRPEDIERANQLFDLVSRRGRDRSVTDIVEKSFIRAVAYELLSSLPEGFTGGRLVDPVLQVYAAKRDSYYPLGYDLRTLEVAVDKQARRKIGDEYPRKAVTAEFWSNEVFSDLDLTEFEWDMRQNLRSTVTNGYLVPKVLTHIFRDRWAAEPTVVDVGTSLGLGLKKWKLYNEFPFDPEAVLCRPRSGEPVSPHLAPDFLAQEKLDDLTRQEPVIGRAVGIDILPVQPSELNLVYSATFPLGSSQINSSESKEFLALAEASMPDVVLPKRNIDASNSESLTQLTEFLPSGKADIFIFSGVLLQVPPDELDAFFGNFLPFCNEGALFIINEWADVDPTRPSGIRIMDEDYWHKGQFKTLIKDPFRPEDKPIEFCRHLNRQCKQMYLSKAGRRLLLAA